MAAGTETAGRVRESRAVAYQTGCETMTKLGLFVSLEAKPGKEAELADFLSGALPLVEAEPDTTAWFAIRIDASTFGIFDAFPDEKGREAHLAGDVAKALMAKAPVLLAKPPRIEKIEVLADKLPGRGG
jgi:quinol monooxygenase YgiN